MGRTLDFMGTLDDLPIEKEEKQMDALAIRKDWIATGYDLENAMERAKSSGNQSSGPWVSVAECSN